MASWEIDRETLRETVVDREALERQLESAGALDRIWILRILGRLREAEVAARAELATAEDRWRPLMLLADVLSWQGRFADAAILHEEAKALADSPSRQATTAQHVGKRLFESGRTTEAADHFAEALRLREASGAPAGLIDSSRIALERARD